MLSDVSILVTAGGRPGYLDKALYGIRANLPECKVAVVNDDGVVNRQFHPTVFWKEMPYDTFLTAKRNAGVALIDTKYTLLAADDFAFTLDTRVAVIKMVDILDNLGRIDIVAGTVNGKRYEGFLEVKQGEHIKEHRLNDMARPLYGKDIFKVDIAVNWFLARTWVLREVPWDEKIGAIGGEHCDFFLDLKAAHKLVVWTPGLNINEQEKDKSLERPDYRQRRARAASTGHALMMKKRNVKFYYGFDDEVK